MTSSNDDARDRSAADDQAPAESRAPHYLEVELERLVRDDPRTFRFLREGSLDGVWYWDLENPEVEWMSPEFWRLFGVDPADKAHLAAEWQDIIFEEDLALALDNFNKHCADPNHPYDQVVRYRHADGSTVWVRCRGVAVRDSEGKPIRLLGAHNDITPWKNAEERFRAQAQATELANERVAEALAANDELREFAYAAAHDLRAPGNTLNLLLSQAASDLQNGEADKANALIARSLTTLAGMRELLDSLLDYARAASAPTGDEDVALERTIEDVLENLQDLMIETDARVNIDGELPVLRGDPMHFRALFQNLIANALKFHAPATAPVVRIFAAPGEREDVSIVTVADNGVGVDPAHQERIFEMFYRGPNQPKNAGAGLGLSICRRVAQLYGGHIQVRSAAGEGSEFVVILPRPGVEKQKSRRPDSAAEDAAKTW